MEERTSGLILSFVPCNFAFISLESVTNVQEKIPHMYVVYEWIHKDFVKWQKQMYLIILNKEVS